MARFEAAIFDVDGVLVDSPHEEAWRASLCELMEGEWAGIRSETTWSPEAFTHLVYQQEAAGKPRLSGARATLDHFVVPDAEVRAAEYAQRKQSMVLRLIETGKFTPYPDALRFVLDAKGRGILVAAASSSKNAQLLLRQIRIDTFVQEGGLSSPLVRPGLTLRDLFDADVSGHEFEYGKPHPEMFLAAAREVGVSPRHSIVLEDAPAGVQAAKAGGMAAIGLDRADDGDLLRAAGADMVVASLDEVDRAALAEGRLVATS